MMYRNWPAIHKARKMLSRDLAPKKALVAALIKAGPGVAAEAEWLKGNWETEAGFVRGMSGGYNSRIVKTNFVKAKKQLGSLLPGKERKLAELRTRLGSR